MSKITNITMNSLIKEFYKYEKEHELNNDEKSALLAWVQAGNSVHENPSLAENGHGNYIDFIDDYRHDEEIRNTINSLSPKERENYIARLRGEDTIDNLRADLDEMHFKLLIMEKVLKRHGLMDEVTEMINESIKVSENISNAISQISFDELPFD